MFNIKNTLWQLVNLGTIQVCPIAPHKVILFNPSISFCSFKSPNLEGCSSTLSTPPWSTLDIMHPLRIFGLLLACWTLQSQSSPLSSWGPSQTCTKSPIFVSNRHSRSAEALYAEAEGFTLWTHQQCTSFHNKKLIKDSFKMLRLYSSFSSVIYMWQCLEWVWSS